MNDNELRILVFGAHPDDCDVRFGGMALKYRALGHQVKFISMTNGDTGHYSMGGGPLARRRYEEAQASAAIADIEYEIYDIHNGELQPDMPTRKQVVCSIRNYKPDLVVCHRSNDYHPDHRAVGQLVQDAIHAIRVPNVAPLTEALRYSPVMAYLQDRFTEPAGYRVDVAVDIDDVFETVIDMLVCHESQWFEWLPYDSGTLDEVPEGKAARREWFAERMRARFGGVADQGRDKLIETYGEEHGKGVKYAEVLMISEYGGQLEPQQIPELFPFLPQE
jgi:N-acetylglucosamine malate deacetylase 1